jgi:hypothetical protein
MTTAVVCALGVRRTSSGRATLLVVHRRAAVDRAKTEKQVIYE